MIGYKGFCGKLRGAEAGNAVVIVLVILVLAAVGALAYTSGKLKIPGSGVLDNVDLAAGDKAESGEDVDPNPVMAKLNGEEIRREDVIGLINTMPPQMKQIPIDTLFPMALEQLVSNKIIDEKVEGANLDNDPAVKAQLEQAKIQIVRAKFLENSVKERLTEERLQAKYDDYVKNFPDVEEVKVAHILVEDEKLAKSLIKKLNKGGDFAALAKENSKDGSAQNGGDLGYFTKTEVVPPFAEAAFSTEPGQYTKKPVKSDFGYHIIRVDEKRKRPPAEFAQARPFLEQELQRTILDEIVKEWKADVEVERFDINGSPLPEEQEPAAGADDSSVQDADPAAAAEESDAVK